MTGAWGDCRGTCVKIDLSAIADNARVIRRALGDKTLLLAVVKANAYGHGLIPVAKTALDNGASWLGVALPEEGAALRSAGITSPVLVLGGVNEAGAELSVREGLTQTVYDAPGVWHLQSACARLGKTIDVHLKIDTGMNRIGARTGDEINAVLCALAGAKDVRLTGAFTHFADADNPDDAFTRLQYARFEALRPLLPGGLMLHASASDALLRFPWARLDMARAGIALYGCPAEENLPLRPALSFLTHVAYVKEINVGDTVSYGRVFAADGPVRVATLPVGYGDGYHRACSGRAYVLIGGRKCPVLGRVCMDQMMADVSGVPNVQPGDEAVLLGAQGKERITARMLACWAGTICYEVLLAPTARVPVLYE